MGLFILPAKSRPPSRSPTLDRLPSQVKGVKRVVNNLQVIKR